MFFKIRHMTIWVLLVISWGFADDKPLFMGIIVKDNERTLSDFLNRINQLDYDKKAIQLHVDILNDNPEVIKTVKNWCNSLSDKYASVYCEQNFQSPSLIKNTYLQTSGVEWIFITSSDVFLRPFTLRVLTLKNLPVAAPLLRPLPLPNDPYRNFYLSATESGYYKDHPDYFEVAERKKVGTFKADCVHGMYLIQAKYASNLSFEEGCPWDFIAFSNSARKNNVTQFICNEREFGFFIHSHESLKNLALACLSTNVSRDKIIEISAAYRENDLPLKEYQDSFPISEYALYPVLSDLYWVDEKWDWVKSNYIKKGLIWESHIQKLFKSYVKEGDTVLDIGGHIGTHTIALSRCVGPSGVVHTFEPQTKLFTELLVNCHLNSLIMSFHTMWH